MRFPAIYLAALAMLLPGAGRAAEESLPPLKPSLIHDDARLFNPDEAARLEALLAATQQKLGVKLTVATFTYTTGITVNQRAQRLASVWLGDEPGMVFAFDRGSAQPAIAVSAGLWRRYPTDEVTMTVLRTSLEFTKSPPIPSERMLAAIDIAATQLGKLETVRRDRQKSFTADDRELAAGAVAALLVLALGSLWLSRRLRRKRAVQEETYYFPEVHVGMRLGASFGGGTAAEVKARG